MKDKDTILLENAYTKITEEVPGFPSVKRVTNMNSDNVKNTPDEAGYKKYQDSLGVSQLHDQKPLEQQITDIILKYEGDLSDGFDFYNGKNVLPIIAREIASLINSK